VDVRTVILRLSEPCGDGQLHGRVEVVGTGDASTFTDDRALLSLLHAATGVDAGSQPPGSD
jgi:hypothetical protein